MHIFLGSWPPPCVILKENILIGAEVFGKAKNFKTHLDKNQPGWFLSCVGIRWRKSLISIIFLIWPTLEARAEIQKYFVGFLVSMKTLKFALKINWPTLKRKRQKYIKKFYWWKVQWTILLFHLYFTWNDTFSFLFKLILCHYLWSHPL